MNKTRPLNSFFLIPGRAIVKTFLGFCRFTAADASTLLSAYGFHAFELDRLQNNRLNGQKETDSSMQNRETNLPGPFVPFTMFSRGSMDTAMHRSPELSSENGGTQQP